MQAVTEEKETRTEGFNLNEKVVLKGTSLTLDITSHIGRMCARLAGYMLWSAGDKEASDILFHKVGR